MMDMPNAASFQDAALLADDFSDDISWTHSAQAESQLEMEKLYAKSQLEPALRKEMIRLYGADLASVQELVLGFKPDDTHVFSLNFLADLMAQAFIRKRAPISVFVGILALRHFRDEENPWQICADAIVAAASYEVVTLAERTLPGSNESLIEVIVQHEPSSEVQQRIEQFQYPLPMIEKPMTVRHNRQTGYRTIKGSLILKNNHHDDDICLDHINRMNAIPLAVNADVVAFVQNNWKNLDKQKPDETYADFRDRQKAFWKYDTTSRDILEGLSLQPDGIFLTHKVDKRGRTYSQGYHVNYQGNDWAKAVVQLHHVEHLNEE